MEAHTTAAGQGGSGDRLHKLDRGRATVAIDRVDVRLDQTVRPEKRDDGVDRCSPLDRQSDVELLHRRVQVGHNETDVKERVVDGVRWQLTSYPDTASAYVHDDTDTPSGCQLQF